jgi:hypothetical protein
MAADDGPRWLSRTLEKVQFIMVQPRRTTIFGCSSSIRGHAVFNLEDIEISGRYPKDMYVRWDKRGRTPAEIRDENCPAEAPTY